jgi:acyl-coenzyme A synthetase/AMP-(fatty) acid ligase
VPQTPPDGACGTGRFAVDGGTRGSDPMNLAHILAEQAAEHPGRPCPPEVEARIAASSPVTIVDSALPVERKPFAELVERDDGETAALLFTSGTTDRPKGAVLTHGGIRATGSTGHVVLLDELPKGPTGKILKRSIDLTLLARDGQRLESGQA